MIKSLFAICLLFCLISNSNGQFSKQFRRECKSLDSIYLLDISINQKLLVLEKYKDSYSTPARYIDFPYSNYHPESKTLSIIYDKFSVSKTTIAIIRVETWIDHSYGSGGSGYLIKIDKKDRVKNFVVDSLIKIDSLSCDGIFYLTINNKKIQLEKKLNFEFDDHKKITTDELSYDIIKEYSIHNIGYIRRKFSHGN